MQEFQAMFSTTAISSKDWGVDVQKSIEFKISQSVFNVPFDCEEDNCVVRLTGVDDFDKFAGDEGLVSLYFFGSIGYKYNISDSSILYIESTTFEGGYGPFFSTNQRHVKLSKSVFHIQNHRSVTANLIDFQTNYYSEITLEGVLINMTSIDKEVQQVNVMSIGFTVTQKFLDTNILCPLRMNALETLPLKHNELHIYHCETTCTSNMYTYQSGSIIFHNYEHKSRISKNSRTGYSTTNPICNKCPVGAKCSGNIKALPNYWGYRNRDEVIMIRCSPWLLLSR